MKSNVCFFLGILPDTLITPESIIAWLLEHADAILSDSESTSSIYDSESDSVSEINITNPQLMAESVRSFIRFYVIYCYDMLIIDGRVITEHNNLQSPL